LQTKNDRQYYELACIHIRHILIFYAQGAEDLLPQKYIYFKKNKKNTSRWISIEQTLLAI
jgi:hypothetical protein